MSQQHPYWPGSAPIPGFEPNVWPAWRLVAAFAVLAGAVAGAAWSAAARSRFCARRMDRFAVAWIALSGFLHVAFEGYYIVRRRRIAGLQTLFAQLWKEYALSDSRYLTGDGFVVCVETMTVLALGPLCCVAAAAALRGWPARHGLQLVVCTAHLYGVGLYYATGGRGHCRPERLYFWLYYVGLNLPWAVVPLVLLQDSFAQMSRAFAALREAESRPKHD